MLKPGLALLAGILVGAAMTWWAKPSSVTQPGSPAAVVRDIVVVEKMSETAAEQHRDDHYRNLATIEEVYALPTEFARQEALYALAGRSNADALQALIFDANRIADDMDRKAALNVLFFRLTELDAPSALALARSGYFVSVKEIERGIWVAWGRNDLDGALDMAASLNGSRRSFAAQSLYAAFGFMGNETTDRIEAELGVEPNRNTRGRYLYAIADRSPAEAIAYINELRPVDTQRQMTWWLAYYLALDNAQAALGYAHLFDSAVLRETYLGHIRQTSAQNDPKAALARLQAEGKSFSQSGEVHRALSALAASDPDAAQEFFASLSAPNDRASAATLIVVAMAKDDPDKALEWARDNATNARHREQLELMIINALAQTDPERALAEAQNIAGPRTADMVTGVVSVIAQSDPAAAVQYLELINDPQQRKQAQTQLASAWMQKDADGAVNWILGQSEDTVTTLLDNTIWTLVQTNTDAAIRLLPRLSEGSKIGVRHQIAGHLATQSAADAQNFIRQFAGEKDYPQLQASVIEGVVQRDPVAARQLANQITDDAARDRAYMSLLTQMSFSDPRGAVALADQITHEAQRLTATAQIAQAWARTDSAAALRWLRNLPPGQSRGQAISSFVSATADPTPEHIGLLDSIEDEAQRYQARMALVYNLANRDPARARRMLDEMDVPAAERKHVEEYLMRRYTGGRTYYRK